MTLHEAIENVLREFRRPSKSAEIAEHINSHKLYIKGDRTRVTASQVSARVNKYPEVFKINELGISLHDISIKPYRDFMLRLRDLLYRFAPGDVLRINDVVASILFLIHYQNHNIKVNYNKGSKGILLKAFEEFRFSHSKLRDNLSSATDFINSTISEYEAEQILRLIDDYRFNTLPIPSLDEFSSFFNEVVNTFNWKNNFSGGQFSTPKLISSLMCSIYEIPKHAKVFDPFAGRGGLLSDLIRAHREQIEEIFAGDINKSSVDIGSLNIYSTGFEGFDYEQRNAFTEWKGKLNTDFIISNPPFAVRLENFGFQYDWQKIPTSDLSLNVIQLALHHSKKNGKAVLLFPESVLFAIKKEAQFIRQLLINEHLLHGVILLPKNSFKPYTAASSTLLLLDLSKKSISTGVFFYDASEVLANDFEKEIKEITSAFHGESEIKEKARWVSSDEIKANDYDLSVKKYLLQSLVGEEYVSLKEMTVTHFMGSYVPSDNINKSEGIPYIQVGDLVEGEGLGFFNKENVKSFISDSEIISSTVKDIPTGAVLIAKVGTKLKPTIFEGHFQAIASSNIIVLKPTRDLLTEYLVSQLQSEYVQKQIDVIRRYNAIPNFKLSELLSIKIKKLTIEQQQQYLATYYSKKVTDIERLEVKSIEDERYNIISRIKHEVKQPVSSIGIDIGILSAYLEKKEELNETIALDDYAIEPLEGQEKEDIEATKISNILKRIKNSVNEAQDTLQKAEETLNIGRGLLKLELIEVKNFIETTLIPLYINTNCKIELLGKEQTINADKYQLKLLFKHLIENALKYGFTDNWVKEANIIRIEIRSEATRSFLEIIVMNNGRPFSAGFNKALFETQGATTDRNNGSGFGGYHIRKIIENHKGELQIADNEEVQFSDFKVKFKIYLPLNL